MRKCAGMQSNRMTYVILCFVSITVGACLAVLALKFVPIPDSFWNFTLANFIHMIVIILMGTVVARSLSSTNNKSVRKTEWMAKALDELQLQIKETQEVVCNKKPATKKREWGPVIRAFKQYSQKLSVVEICIQEHGSGDDEDFCKDQRRLFDEQKDAITNVGRIDTDVSNDRIRTFEDCAAQATFAISKFRVQHLY